MANQAESGAISGNAQPGVIFAKDSRDFYIKKLLYFFFAYYPIQVA
jgi:hypothetical protein